MTTELVTALRTIAGGPAVAPAERRAAWRVIDAALREAWAEWIARRAGVAEDADDVRQLVLETLLSRRTVFRGETEGEARALLRTMVHNKAVDVRRLRAREVQLVDDDGAQPSGGAVTPEPLSVRDLDRRLQELVVRAGQLQQSPDAAALQRCLRESLVGDTIVEPSVDADPVAAPTLRKRRSRALDLLRRAHEAVLADTDEQRPDQLDRLIAQLLAPKGKNEPED